MAKHYAAEDGLIATFMPKPFADKTGNGAHFNMSMYDLETGKNLFARPHAEGLLYGLIRPAASPIELACVAQPLAHCLLQLPGLDADTKASFRELRAEMET
jgi:hypothetical protein